jgi:predicted alpha/beta-hydrolase family hydrolase
MVRAAQRSQGSDGAWPWLATGVESADLQAIAQELPTRGIAVALVTQPHRLAGRGGIDESSLDAAWRHVWPSVAERGVPVIAGGRSAGSQVACRTVRELGAIDVLALSYPLLGPGSPRELLSTDLPVLIIQGGKDPYGQPDEFPALPSTMQLVEIPFANHTFGVATSSSVEAATTLSTIACTVENWAEVLLIGVERES